jgi:hypothetical protein
MIRLVTEKGRTEPRIVCDSCGEEIRNHYAGIVQYFKDGTIRFVHKNLDGKHCDDDKEDDGWMEIRHWLVHLLHSAGFRSEQEVLNAIKGTVELDNAF